jgi:uncharacterized protein (DUF427 family)
MGHFGERGKARFASSPIGRSHPEVLVMPENSPIESVWDYPRPPLVEPVRHRLMVIFANAVIADTRSGIRILETSHPPTYYFPPSDVARDLLRRADGNTMCEFKGVAEYVSVCVGDQMVRRAAWFYPYPDPPYEAIADFFAFYPSRVDMCLVGNEQVTAQEGDFYGGWITANLRGPFKGSPGSGGW